MINLISENKFDELKEKLKNSDGEFTIHNFLLSSLNNEKIEIDNESFNAKRYQEEFFEGFKIYKALEKSNISEEQLKEYSNILVELTFKMGGFIQLMSNTAMNKGVYLSDIAEIYKVNPNLRNELQNYIELLKKRNEIKSLANVCAVKSQLSNAIGNLINKYEIGQDMIQFAESYEKVDQVEIAKKIYQGIMNDFESESVKSSSGLFPEISQVDTRPKEEIEIFEKAKANYEKLTGQKLPEIKRIHIDNEINAKKLFEETERKIIENKQNDFENDKEESNGFFKRLLNIFKKNYAQQRFGAIGVLGKL